MADADPNRIVHCIKLKKDLPGLLRQPFPNDLGKHIFENVSKEAWDLWVSESVRYINTYRMDLQTRAGTEQLLKLMRVWLGMEEGEMLPTAWTPPKEDKSE